MSSIALVDCNNFFVSCERLFKPNLLKRPVAVLSCNDGCIISRSQEVKALGVPMGAPYFKWADFLKAHDVAIFSSNFSLYADLSYRVMHTLEQFNPELEIYSIDEAFLRIEGMQNPQEHAKKIGATLLKWVGIPVSIGIAKTKTLAKIAGDFAKASPSGVFLLRDNEVPSLLEKIAVKEVWGIGRRMSEHLARHGIHSASQLCQREDSWIRSHFSVTGLRTVWELGGIPSLGLDEVPAAKQSVMTSRSFGRPVFTQAELAEALCSHAARGAEKLREEGQLASWLQVLIATSPHGEGKYYSNQTFLTFPQPTHYTPHLFKAVVQGLNTIFRPGFAYKRAGVLLGGLIPKEEYPQDLFLKPCPATEKKEQALMDVLDQINQKFGKRSLHFASQGIEQRWAMKQNLCSAGYTTRWSEILTIQI